MYNTKLMDVISGGQLAIAASSLQSKRHMLHGDQQNISFHHQNGQQKDQIMTMREDKTASLSSASSLHGSASSIGSLSSLDLVDDATSPTSSSFCSLLSNSNGPLFEFSELMAQLPIKKGLSRYYEGKSKSFTSLSGVTSTEDLVKKRIPLKSRKRTYNRYGGGKDGHRSYTLPKATICKGASQVTMISMSSLSGKRSFS